MADIGLRREMGLWPAIALVVGTVIGSGIFIVPKMMIQHTGSPVTVLAVFIFGGVLSLAGALTYAEMAAMMPEAGGEYVYLREAYGPFFGFLYGWTQMWVAKAASIATMATGFFYYLANFVPVLDRVIATVPLPLGEHGAPLEIRAGQLCAMAVIMVLAFINWLGLRQGSGVQVVVTALKVALFAAVIGCGLFLGYAHPSNLATSIAPTTGGVAGFFAALVAALWAYDGWNNLGMAAGEVRDPQRNMPRALVLGTFFVILIYVAANVAYFSVLNAAQVASSDRVAATMLRVVFGPVGAGAVSVAAMVSILSALNGAILTGSRVPYALARDGYFFKPFARVHPERRVPGFSILALSAWGAVLVLSGRFDQLATLVIFPSWILYGMATAAVIVFRRKRPNAERPYRTLGYPLVPIIFVLVALLLLGFTLYNSPRESGLGLILIAAGVPFYQNWAKKAATNRPQ